MTTILYNSIDPFSGLAPTPLFQRRASMVRFGQRWAQKHDITLQGQLTGKCITYQDFLDRQQELLSGFNKDFQTLEIYDSGSLVEDFEFVKINSINFDDSTYSNGYVPFTIQLENYPQELFSGVFGVLEPSEELKFSEDDDGTIKLIHSTSAVGFCTSAADPSNALENARQWVAARTGWSSQILPAFISGVENGMCLQTIGEHYDRLNGRYEVTETYIGSVFDDAASGPLKYSTDFSSGIQEGICTVEVKGEIQGCRYQELQPLRDRYLGFDAFSEAVNRFEQITDRTDLNVIPVSKGVSEDKNNKVIQFNYTFNDDLRPKVNVSFSIDFSYDFAADIVSASISATVSSKGPYTSTKWAEVLQVANAINLLSLVVPAYNAYVLLVAPHLAGAPLNTKPRSQSRSDNEFRTTVTLSASYDNAPAPPPGLDSFSPSLSFKPSIHKYAAAPILDGEGQYYIFDLGYRCRGALDVSVRGLGSDATTPEQTLAILKTQAQNLQIDYFSGPRLILDQQSYVTGNAGFGKSQTVSASFSAESPEFTL